ncbi:hypothetical protein ACH9DO_14895 [Kocuria sp. M1N1S27]|uniref:hypothetical protein n=1 Tax=Kocuria kalidii TaxID=3376283 RepID=UPI003799D1DD
MSTTDQFPEHDDWAPFRARLASKPSRGVTLAIYNHAQSPAREEATLRVETESDADTTAGRVELLDQALGFHGYHRSSRPRWIPATPGSDLWSVFCDVHPAGDEVTA